MKKLHIAFQPIGRRATIDIGQTILDAAQISVVGLASICGGTGTCEECKVKLITGQLTPPTEVEVNALGEEAILNGWRLACQCGPLADVKIHIPPESMTTIQRLQVDGEDIEFHLNPVDHEPGSFGMAIDVGTTKVAVYIIDLYSGKTVAKDGFMNPQIAFGEDVISRLSYIERVTEGSGLLQKALFQSINQLLPSLLGNDRCSAHQIHDVVLVGNTAMHHIAAGLPVKQLGHSPFSPATLDSLSIDAQHLGLNISKNAQIYFPPVIAGYVGSDHLAMLLSLGLGLENDEKNNIYAQNKRKSLPKLSKENQKNIIAIDIGTNTEISLISGDDIISCSCASGPAFEGAHIQEGMRASPGAIERASWYDGKILWQTIASQPPIGICGSGILDIVSSLLQGNLLKSSGQLVTVSPFPIVSVVESGLGREIVITRKDIHEIQLAKSAIRTAMDMLIHEIGLEYDLIDKFIIAGAFGTYLDIKNAIRVGMFPHAPLDKFEQVGNAAGVGAKRLLLSVTARNVGELLAKRVQYLELASKKEFQELFIKNLVFNK